MMSTATKRLPLIDLPIGEHKRSLGTLQVQSAGNKCALPLQGVEISAKVADRVASVTVHQKFKNSFSEHLEAVYIFPLSGGCVVSDFEMRVGTRVVKGIVEERQAAREQYQKAIQQGKRAALLEQERDDVFTVQVGNVPPDEEIEITLTYSERLPFFENGKTELRLPLVVSPRYIPGDGLERDQVGDGTEHDTNFVPDASRITPPRLASAFDPKVGLSVSVEIATADDSGTETISELACSQHATEVGIEAGQVKIELARNDERLNRDFVLQWRLAVNAVRSSMLVYKNDLGESYAMLSVTPPKRDGYVGAPRDVVFVLDRSGSMMGPKMVSAATACSILLSTLGPSDRFAIQAFDDCNEWLTQPRVQGRAAHWINADEAGLEKGQKFLRSIDARGGTEMDRAIEEAFETVAHRPSADGRVPVVVVLTDGEVGDESRILRRVQTQLGDARLFAVGIDTSVNSGLLRRLSNLGGGTATFVQPGTSLENALRSVGREIGEPVITDLELINDGAIENDSIAPNRIPDLFAGRAVTVFCRLTGKGSVRVRGKWSDGKVFDEKLKQRAVPVKAVAQLWAKAAISDLEDSFRLQPHSKVRQQIIDLSVKHSLLTRFTAFVAVDHAEIVNKDGTLRRIVQPVEAPDSWDMLKDADTLSRARSSWGSVTGSFGAPPASAPMSGGWGSAAAGSFGAADEWGSPAPQQQAFSMSCDPPEECDAESREESGGLFCREDAGIDQVFGSLGSAKKEKADDSEVMRRLNGAGQSAQAPVPQLPAAPAPTPQAPPPPPPAGNRPTGGLMGKIGGLFRTDDKARGKRPTISNEEINKMKEVADLLSKFAAALQAALATINSGSVPDCSELEQVRSVLLASLSNADCGTQVPLLQKFLRGAAVELVHSTKQQGVTAAGIQPIWERHMQAFDKAQAEATTQLSGAGSEDKFWEASV